MSPERIVVHGREELMKSKEYRAARDEVIAAARARYAESLASAGFFRRLVLHSRMQREINRELDKLAPPGALYLQSK